jgi:hypothetical protein
MGTDTGAEYSARLVGPARHGAAVTPHDTNELDNYSRALWVGGAGNIALTTAGGDSITLSNIVAGSLIPIQAKIVLSTGTTATNIVALY